MQQFLPVNGNNLIFSKSKGFYTTNNYMKINDHDMKLYVTNDEIRKMSLDSIN